MQHELKTTIGDGLPVEVIFDTLPEGEIEITAVKVGNFDIFWQLGQGTRTDLFALCNEQLNKEKQEALEIAYR